MADRERFERIYGDHFEHILRYFLRRVDRDDAADATSEVFSVCWRRLDDIPEGAELPWLYGVAGRILLHRRRSSARYARSLPRFVETQTIDDVESEVLRDESAANVRSALHRLNARDREVIRLASWEDLDRGELAAALGCSTNTASKRLSRALDRLATELGASERPHGPRLMRRATR